MITVTTITMTTITMTTRVTTKTLTPIIFNLDWFKILLEFLGRFQSDDNDNSDNNNNKDISFLKMNKRVVDNKETHILLHV